MDSTYLLNYVSFLARLLIYGKAVIQIAQAPVFFRGIVLHRESSSKSLANIRQNVFGQEKFLFL